MLDAIAATLSMRRYMLRFPVVVAPSIPRSNASSHTAAWDKLHRGLMLRYLRRSVIRTWPLDRSSPMSAPRPFNRSTRSHTSLTRSRALVLIVSIIILLVLGSLDSLISYCRPSDPRPVQDDAQSHLV